MEEWKPIEGYEGFYEVSNWGRVRSIPRKVPCKNGMIQSVKGGMRKPCHYSNGYCFVILSKDGEPKMHLLHRLVARAFLGKSQLEVNHKNGDKDDNRAENLEYMSHSQNIKHSYSVLGRQANAPYRGKRGFEHNKSIGVKVKDVITGDELVFGSYRLAAENGFNRRAIKMRIDKQSLYKQRYLFCSL